MPLFFEPVAEGETDVLSVHPLVVTWAGSGRVGLVCCLLSVASLVAGCAGSSGVSSTLPDSTPLSLELASDSTSYSVEGARRGAVGFTATIRNAGSTPIVVGHPSVCFPAGYRRGQSIDARERRGNSEILLEIERPDGEIVVLRESPMSRFEPGRFDHVRFDHVRLPPGGSGSFRLGWFFENARGKWEDDREAWRVFTDPGVYRVEAILRNRWPKALIRDASGESVFVDVWTGEIRSPEVVLQID